MEKWTKILDKNWGQTVQQPTSIYKDKTYNAFYNF